MANPTRYKRDYSFSGYQANNPQKPLPGPKVDEELDDLERTTDEIIDAMSQIRRADGRLANGIVTREALSVEFSSGVSPSELWQAGVQYGLGASISYANALYRCVIEHVSSDLEDDIAAGYWEGYATFTPDFATPEEALAGVDTQKQMSPYLTKLQVDGEMAGVERTANKGQPNGYPALDENALIPLPILPDAIYLPMEAYDTPAAARAGVDHTAAWDAAVTLANLTGKQFYPMPSLTNSARRWVKLQPGRQFPKWAKTRVGGPIGIAFSVAVGVGFHQRDICDIEGDWLIDGGNTLDQVLGGYVDNHTGMRIEHTTPTTEIFGVSIKGKFKFQNFGCFGLETYWLTDPVFEGISAERIGAGGVVHWSVKNLLQVGGRIKNIFPGIVTSILWANSTAYVQASVGPPAVAASVVTDASNGRMYECKVSHTSPASGTFAAARAANPTYWEEVWERNAYGLTTSQFTGGRQSTGRIIGLFVEDVRTWTGIDTHSSAGIKVIGCTVTGCSQGIAAENHIPGLTMFGFEAQGNLVEGFGGAGSAPKDGLPCYSVGGIILNASGAPASTRCAIRGNEVFGCGERRALGGDGAAISVRNARGATVENNDIGSSQSCVINIIGQVSGTDQCLDVKVMNNKSIGVASFLTKQYGVQYYSYVQGVIKDNMMVGSSSAANSYNRAGPATLPVSVGAISAYGAVGDNWWN